MLRFENGYAGDQSGVRFAARDGGRRVLFRVEKQAVIGGLGLQPVGCEPLEALMQNHMEDVRRGCLRAYADTPNHDNLTIIKVEKHHFGHC
jgi:hypothetical protein